ncbi:uncharacterized protein P884DRAFT_267003 [Thermothelomyces heterothallicus CBS 202.75]|uniref:uncharacterized protein n=1 Tax=Thermothelomyces heterothallicus CBS 202.75 TaxID=1149848 RepID=UPI003742A7F6
MARNGPPRARNGAPPAWRNAAQLIPKPGAAELVQGACQRKSLLMMRDNKERGFRLATNSRNPMLIMFDPGDEKDSGAVRLWWVFGESYQPRRRQALNFYPDCWAVHVALLPREGYVAYAGRLLPSSRDEEATRYETVTTSPNLRNRPVALGGMCTVEETSSGWVPAIPHKGC